MTFCVSTAEAYSREFPEAAAANAENEKATRKQSGSSSPKAEKDGSVGLKRRVGLMGSIALIVGSMIG